MKNESIGSPFGEDGQLRDERQGSVEGLVEALRGLLCLHDENTCVHENTHRGGAIWTICDSCGRKWADDEGGFKAYVDPPEVSKARAILARSAAGQADAACVQVRAVQP